LIKGNVERGFVADSEFVVPGGDGTVAPPARPLFLRLRIWSAFSGMVQRMPRRRK
jgi:hypothetical protein